MDAEIADLRKESFEFRQQIIVGAQSERTGSSKQLFVVV